MKASLLLFTSFCVAEFFCFIQDFPFYFQISHSLGSDSHYGTPRDLRMFQEILFAEGVFFAIWSFGSIITYSCWRAKTAYCRISFVISLIEYSPLTKSNIFSSALNTVFDIFLIGDLRGLGVTRVKDSPSSGGSSSSGWLSEEHCVSGCSFSSSLEGVSGVTSVGVTSAGLSSASSEVSSSLMWSALSTSAVVVSCREGKAVWGARN